jgi:hypothetical protein
MAKPFFLYIIQTSLDKPPALKDHLLLAIGGVNHL